MNPDYENQLERQIDRALKELPPLRAPASLSPRVLRAIAARKARPWYRLSWQEWPAPLQAAAMILLVAMFGSLCFAAWQLTRAAGYANAMEELRQTFSGLSVIWNTIQVLFGAIVLIVKKLGSGFMIGCLAAMGLAYAMCVGLGTMFVRFVYARN